jgi:LacI family gluconate utilization system Gnt-I transcriptional repressor
MEKTTRKDSKPLQISLDDVAKEAGVSKMTVSRVLRGTSGFSKKTHKRVTEAADKLGYVNNKLAVAFNSTSKSTLIGICVPTISGELFSDILEGIESKLSAVGYEAMIAAIGYGQESEEDWISTVVQWRPSGLILTKRRRSNKVNELIKSQNIPFVEVWGLDSKPASLCVGFNQFDAGYEMAQHLISKRYCNIAYLGTRQEAYTLGEERLAGFKQALKANGLSLAHELLLNDRSSFYAGHYGTEHLLLSHPKVDAIYYLDDNMAVGGMMLCQKKGLSVPRDIAIAGFGGMSIAAVLPQRLTTTNSFRRRIGKQAAELLLQEINGPTPIKKVKDVGFELVKGDTA